MPAKTDYARKSKYKTNKYTLLTYPRSVRSKRL